MLDAGAINVQRDRLQHLTFSARMAKLLVRGFQPDNGSRFRYNDLAIQRQKTLDGNPRCRPGWPTYFSASVFEIHGMHDRPETVSFRRRHLPHWSVDAAPYFVTVRLAGSLPAVVVRQLKLERDQLAAAHATGSEFDKLRRRQFQQLERILDVAEPDNAFLAQDAIAQLVVNSLNWMQKELHWQLFAYTIMPNHLHLIMQHFEGRNGALAEDLGRLKSYTGLKANQTLNRTGAFWQQENFDHWIRSPEKFDAAVRYVHNNPVKAGLVSHWQDWPWTK